METLIDVLVRYAAENVVSRFERENFAQTWAASDKVDELTERLEALSPEAKQLMEELKKEQVTIDFDQERAALLAGISIGLELGRL